MSIKSLLRQTLTIYTQTSYNAEGREVVGAGTDYDCRFQAASKEKLMPGGSKASLDAIAYVLPTTTVSEDDHVTYDGVRYKIIGIYETPGGDGQTKFKKLELSQWPQT